ncbi:hypothetical protein JI721_12535 [Alicyclobacillus cycloheptanicus]|uniref:Spore germination protein gerPA/gerPF n=1 Tax=Alicyclobacillus cycloheptanicus TaxID=1457 RepID=A0ABT9XEU8_9BACL|nr:hypothetical protein [Alicyclobacillus cycloheptanicus]MDQ0188818.1 hypothetical protein [Alicyclobacillus cycloheptanicus]WDM00533.1 hypothetical protein JI721_12535 [Alicyclobacillus cycloheptanicus]
MPSLIAIGTIMQNTPQQNAGVFLGEGNVGGWDCNRKMSQAYAGTWGFFNALPIQVNVNIDNFELIDGTIFDSDWKGAQAANA